MQHRTLVASAIVAGLIVTTGAIALGANLTSVSGQTSKVTPANEVVQPGDGSTPTTIVTLVEDATDRSSAGTPGSDDTQSTATSSSNGDQRTVSASSDDASESESESELESESEREHSSASTSSTDGRGHGGDDG